RAAVAGGADVLVVVGGDGAVRLAAQACSGTGTALGMVPSGTGNDTARSLDVPLRTADALGVVLAGRRRRIDLIATDVPGQDVVVASVPAGVDARIAERSAGLPRWLGPAVYAVATLPEVPRLRPRRYRLDLDGSVRELDALVVAVCNLPVYGGGMRIAPDADPADGLLDVVVIGPVRPGQALGLLAGVFRGRHTGHPAVSVHRAATVGVAGPAEILAHADGDPLGRLPLRLAVRPAALQVLVP
ncbi:diacylglycerol/lipid kinase family protein, partial [Ornithinicoccus halotolerans]|uniref:diacylglycerol/lipid kinase family protein n=1 Tax=Ornithinicoccus halotolerans TaxID=1748220 RepID=UPI00129782F8